LPPLERRKQKKRISELTPTTIMANENKSKKIPSNNNRRARTQKNNAVEEDKQVVDLEAKGVESDEEEDSKA
jgi:hypothetical protein